LDKSKIYKFLKPTFGMGLLTAPGKIYLNVFGNHSIFLVDVCFRKFRDYLFNL